VDRSGRYGSSLPRTIRSGSRTQPRRDHGTRSVEQAIRLSAPTSRGPRRSRAGGELRRLAAALNSGNRTVFVVGGSMGP
jgi:hypothetical protein